MESGSIRPPEVTTEVREYGSTIRLTFWDWFPGVFTNPKRIFMAMKHRGPRVQDWMVPVIICSIVFTVALLFIYISGNVEYLPNGSKYSTQDDPETPFIYFISFLLFPIVSAIGLFLYGFALWIAGHITLQRSFPFLLALSIFSVPMIVKFVGVALTYSLSAILQTHLRFDVANVLNMGEGGVLSTLLQQFEVFNLYGLFLLGFGIYITTGTSKKRAALTVIAMYGIMIVVASLPMAIRFL